MKKNNQELVSVVIPCYNHEAYVKEAIQSVIDQDYKNIELIIIDDGSKDNTVEILNDMEEQCRDRFVRFEKRSRNNKGLCQTLNEALEWSKGIYFCPLASDDKWMPNKTSLQVQHLSKNADTAAVFGGIIIIDEKGNKIRTISRAGIYGFKEIFLHKSFAPAPTAMVRMREIRKYYYDPLVKVEDLSTWLKITYKQKNVIESLDIPFAYYRRHGANISGQAEVIHSEIVKIFSEYIDNEYYSDATSQLNLSTSFNLAYSNKKRATYFLYEYLKKDGFTKDFFRALVKILVPKFLGKRFS